MRAVVLGLLLSVVLVGHASAYDANDPANCNGADWDDKLALTVSKVTAAPRVNFIKSPYDDDFAAAACPARTKACQKKSYLVTGDLVLIGRTRGDFTCVSYQAPLAKKQIWANGWLPSAALTPVAPMLSPKLSDWIGTWCNPGCRIEISNGDGGKLRIEAEGLFRPRVIFTMVPSGRTWRRKTTQSPSSTTAPITVTNAECGCSASVRGCWSWTIPAAAERG